MVCSDRNATAIARSLSIPSIRPKTVTALGEVSGDRSGWKGDMPMPAKNRGRRYFFTGQKIQEYNRTIIRLRNLECDAFLELRKIARLNLVSKRCQDAGVFFAAVAAEMTSALQFLVELLHSAQQPSRTLVEFVYAPVCDKCMASPYEREEYHPGVEAPPLDPAHYSELEELLAFVNHSSERLWSLRTGRKTLLAALSRGLKRLGNVLVKLLRHFREMAPALPARFESHEYDGGDCSRCHGPLIILAGERPARERNEIE
jgi:hypothetical protein